MQKKCMFIIIPLNRNVNQKRSAYENFTASILEDRYPTRLEPQQLPEPRTAAPGAMVFR